MRGKRWTQDETDIIRKYYPHGGSLAVQKQLPHRTLAMILGRASTLKITTTARRSKGVPSSEFIDAAIRRAYQSTPYRGLQTDLARQLNRTPWWIRTRAMKLGVATYTKRSPEWTEAELELLEECKHFNPHVIAKHFREAGYNRTALAISIKRQRSKMGTDGDGLYSANSLAVALGVDPSTVSRYIKRGILKANKAGTQRTDNQGGDEYLITKASVKKMLITHTAEIDFRKIDKFWLVDILAPNAAKKAA